MWLTTQMHREEELAAMQYPAGNWSSSCNKIAGTCGTSQWPFECLAEGERCFCFAFPRESIATSIILHGGIDEGTAEEGDKGAVSSSFYLGGSYQIHGGGVIASLGNHCTEFDEFHPESRGSLLNEGAIIRRQGTQDSVHFRKEGPGRRLPRTTMTFLQMPGTSPIHIISMLPYFSGNTPHHGL
ncbi:uncharacterized protein [Dermacentor albipictus]|uniref:uncharacterized protein isoform X1 n=1 Tax=Dermacentor albipictus TaxID=60249 RepID=UPI0038FD26CE